MVIIRTWGSKRLIWIQSKPAVTVAIPSFSRTAASAARISIAAIAWRSFLDQKIRGGFHLSCEGNVWAGISMSKKKIEGKWVCTMCGGLWGDEATCESCGASARMEDLPFSADCLDLADPGEDIEFECGEERHD